MLDNNVVKISSKFPSFVFDVIGENCKTYRQEVNELYKLFAVYDYGANFNVEGTNGDYVASQIHFKKIKMLINKEARFMFSQTPEILINPLTNEEVEDEQQKEACNNLNIVLNKVLENSDFSIKLLQSAKDCFVGKRVAALIDYSNEDNQGIQVHFYNSLQFYHEYKYGTKLLKRLVTFECVYDSITLSERKFIVNDYRTENEAVYLTSAIYDGAGRVVEELITDLKTELKEIPAVIIINESSLLDKNGISDVESLIELESGYSKLSNSDIDSERKGMNPIRYTIDMDANTTKNLPSGAGAYWDLQHDMNLDNPSPSVGTLSPSLSHTEPVKTTLERIETTMFQELEIPNISQESMVGTITSGKALKALYYPLTVRCDEKFIVWNSSIKKIVRHVIDFILSNINEIETMYEVVDIVPVAYDIVINKKYALMDDEAEEKEMDISEVINNIMSRKSYMKKHRRDLLTDGQIEQELQQIAIESNMLDSLTNPQLRTNIEEEEIEQDVDKNIEETEIEEDLEVIGTENQGDEE